MTKEQIDILVKDGDIVPGEGLIYLHEKQYGLGEAFFETLKKIFERYLHHKLYGDYFSFSGSIELYQNRIKSRIEELSLSKDQQINFLNSKIQEEVNCLEKLRTGFPWEESIKDRKESWYYHILNKLETVIELLKFKILKGEKINSIDFTFTDFLPSFYLLDEYFLSNSMEEIYEVVAIEENIKFLQGKINQIENQNILNTKINIQQPVENVLSEIMASENKFYKKMDMEFVIEHFKVMTKRKNENGIPYLTMEQFISFLKRGFLKDTTQPKQKVNCLSGEKGFVILRFFDFYDKAVSEYWHPAKKRNFINLFIDCFDNWEPSTIRPFFKKGKTSKEW